MSSIHRIPRGDITLGKYLDKGGFAEVFEGTRRGGAPVAVKRLFGGLSEQSKTAFRREVDMMCQLRCDVVVSVYGLVDDLGQGACCNFAPVYESVQLWFRRCWRRHALRLRARCACMLGLRAKHMRRRVKAALLHAAYERIHSGGNASAVCTSRLQGQRCGTCTRHVTCAGALARRASALADGRGSSAKEAAECAASGHAEVRLPCVTRQLLIARRDACNMRVKRKATYQTGKLFQLRVTCQAWAVLLQQHPAALHQYRIPVLTSQDARASTAAQ